MGETGREEGERVRLTSDARETSGVSSGGQISRPSSAKGGIFARERIRLFVRSFCTTPIADRFAVVLIIVPHSARCGYLAGAA